MIVLMSCVFHSRRLRCSKVRYSRYLWRATRMSVSVGSVRKSDKILHKELAGVDVVRDVGASIVVVCLRSEPIGPCASMPLSRSEVFHKLSDTFSRGLGMCSSGMGCIGDAIQNSCGGGCIGLLDPNEALSTCPTRVILHVALATIYPCVFLVNPWQDLLDPLHVEVVVFIGVLGSVLVDWALLCLSLWEEVGRVEVGLRKRAPTFGLFCAWADSICISSWWRRTGTSL